MDLPIFLSSSIAISPFANLPTFPDGKTKAHCLPKNLYFYPSEAVSIFTGMIFSDFNLGFVFFLF